MISATLFSKPVSSAYLLNYKASYKISEVVESILKASSSVTNLLTGKWVFSVPKRTVALLAFSTLWNRVQGQDTFFKTYGGAGFDYAFDFDIDKNDFVVTAGFSNNAGKSDLLITKWDSSGSLSWDRTLDTGAIDIARAVAIDSNGDIFVTGTTNYLGQRPDMVIAKLNTSGSLVWTKTLGSLDHDDAANDVHTDLRDDIITIGYTYSSGAGNADLFLAKWNTTGSLYWAITLGGTGYDEGYAVTTDLSGNIVATGRTQSYGGGLDDLLLAKWDSNGSLNWVKTLGGSKSDVALAVVISESGDMITAGQTASFVSGPGDLLLALWDSSGSFVWAKSLGELYTDSAYSLCLDSLGNILTAGMTKSYGSGVYFDVFITKWDPSGNLIWAGAIGGSNNDYGYTLSIDSNGFIVTTGLTDGFGVKGDDIFLSRVTSDGSMHNCSYFRLVNATAVNQTSFSITSPLATNLFWTNSTLTSFSNVTVSSIVNATLNVLCLPLTTTGIATTGVVTTGIATTGVVTTGPVTTGVPTTGVVTTGIASTGVATTGVVTTGVATTGIATTGPVTTGVRTTSQPTTSSPTTGPKPPGVTTSAVTTGPKPPGITTTSSSGGNIPPPGRQSNDVGLALGLTFGLGSFLTAVGGIILGLFLWRRKVQKSQKNGLELSNSSTPASPSEHVYENVLAGLSSPGSVNEHHPYQNISKTQKAQNPYETFPSEELKTSNASDNVQGSSHNYQNISQY